MTETSVILQELENEEDIEEAKAQGKRHLDWVLSSSKDMHRSQDHSSGASQGFGLLVYYIFTANDNDFANIQITASEANYKTGGVSDEVTVDTDLQKLGLNQVHLSISPSPSSSMQHSRQRREET